MNQYWFRLSLWAVILASLLGLALMIPAAASVRAQVPATPTLGGSQPFITNTYTTEPFINVRAGPSSVYYGSPIGQLAIGATVRALAITPGHDWIEISFPSGPNGVGWVYAPNVTLGQVVVTETVGTETFGSRSTGSRVRQTRPSSPSAAMRMMTARSPISSTARRRAPAVRSTAVAPRSRASAISLAGSSLPR